jgi:hypothetical protein
MVGSQAGDTPSAAQSYLPPSTSAGTSFIRASSIKASGNKQPIPKELRGLRYVQY